MKNILLLALKNELGSYIQTILVDHLPEWNLKIVENQDDLLDELEKENYPIVILSNNSISAHLLPDLISKIKGKFPNKKIMVLSGFSIQNLNAPFFDLPLDVEKFLKVLKDYS